MHVAVDEFLKQWNLLVSNRDHVQAQYRNHLTISHPLIVIGIDLMQQILHLSFI